MDKAEIDIVLDLIEQYRTQDTDERSRLSLISDSVLDNMGVEELEILDKITENTRRNISSWIDARQP
jgi:hypothetical protein